MKWRKVALVLAVLLIVMAALVNGVVDMGAYEYAPGELVAETSLAEELLTKTDIVRIKVNIDGIKDLYTGLSEDAPGGIASYEATASYGAGKVSMKSMVGVAPFTTVTPNYSFDASGSFLFNSFQTGSQPQAPLTIAKLVPILTGTATETVTLTVDFGLLTDVNGANIPEHPDLPLASMSFKRGDTNGDGNITIVDALFIAQYLAGLKTADAINVLNAASVAHDGAAGDNITIVDALFIAQYLALLRNADYHPTPIPIPTPTPTPTPTPGPTPTPDPEREAILAFTRQALEIEAQRNEIASHYEGFKDYPPEIRAWAGTKYADEIDPFIPQLTLLDSPQRMQAIKDSLVLIYNMEIEATQTQITEVATAFYPWLNKDNIEEYVEEWEKAADDFLEAGGSWSNPYGQWLWQQRHNPWVDAQLFRLETYTRWAQLLRDHGIDPDTIMPTPTGGTTPVGIPTLVPAPTITALPTQPPTPTPWTLLPPPR